MQLKGENRVKEFKNKPAEHSSSSDSSGSDSTNILNRSNYVDTVNRLRGRPEPVIRSDRRNNSGSNGGAGESRITRVSDEINRLSTKSGKIDSTPHPAKIAEKKADELIAQMEAAEYVPPVLVRAGVRDRVKFQQAFEDNGASQETITEHMSLFDRFHSMRKPLGSKMEEEINQSEHPKISMALRERVTEMQQLYNEARKKITNDLDKPETSDELTRSVQKHTEMHDHLMNRIDDNCPPADKNKFLNMYYRIQYRQTRDVFQKHLRPDQQKPNEEKISAFVGMQASYLDEELAFDAKIQDLPVNNYFASRDEKSF